ncbi:hypothetical protein FV222_00330 [Methylobacterium sp. WL103]|uniref:hypothetical protein n=1 Tax=Methylobacterium sp. WL103 TaxID=2603891 RepID=UPI0011C81A5C|nr:hypothetical protein [Methylobacterium sp. WL103]TXN08951.1 hypothetical protein FV222_00330 [Methylobacterium sp. WL103]
MPLQRKPTSKQLAGLEIARNLNWFQSVFFGFERAVFQAPTSFFGVFGQPLRVLLFSIAIIVCGIPLWVLIHFGYLLMGLAGHLRRDSSVRNNQSVVS